MSSRALVLLSVGVAAGAGFALLARAVARRDTAAVDRTVHPKMAVDRDHPARDLAEKAAPIGKWWTYTPAAVLTAAYVVAKGREEDGRSAVFGASAIVVAAVAAATINKRLDALPQPPAPPGRKRPDHPVFPSGHAFGTSAVALTAAYVLSREKLATAAIAFPVAFLVPLASSAARLMEEKHWLSDVAGGYCAAVTLSALTLAAYETLGASDR